MNPNKPQEKIEAEIDKAFEELELSNQPLSKFLSDLDLEPLRRQVMRCYGGGSGSNRKYSPMAMAYSLIYEEALGIGARTRTIRRLKRNLNEAKDLGFTMDTGIPNPQNYLYFTRDKMDEETLELIEHTARYIQKKNTETDKLLEVDSWEEASETSSKGERQGAVDKKFKEISNFLKWKVFPELKFPRADNITYDDIEFLDLLTFTGMRNVCTTEGYNLFTELTDRDIPHADTLLHHVRNTDRGEIYRMYEEGNEKILNLAKERGRLDREVDVAIDFTNVRYYGDKNDEMVIETKPKDGTSHAYQFATLKIVSGGEHYTLRAVPVGKFRGKKSVVESLLDYAEQVVEIRRVYADRGFFSIEILNLFEERGLRYIVPAIRNSRVKRRMEEVETPYIEQYTMENNRETVTFNLVVLTPDDEDDDSKPFATNCGKLEILTQNLFDLYSRRWDIETGYRVSKENFYPKTTSKNYNVRLFYFLFSQLLYNTWILTNVAVSLHLYDEIRGEKLVTAQEFVTRLFQSYIDYG